MGAIQKVGKFLGISKLGQGIATTARVLSGETGKDIERNVQNTLAAQKILYAAKQEKDQAKKQQLLNLSKTIGNMPTAQQIDPGLELSNREILGSAANIGLNILTPGAFKGGKAAVLAKNAALGSGFGAAGGMEKGRSGGGIVGSAIGGALVGTAIGGVGLAAKGLKEFATKTTPEWLMNKAVKPTLDDLRKNIKYGTDTLGKELLNEGVSGSPEKLLRIADEKLNSFEDELQTILNSPTLSEARINREQIMPYAKDLIETKAGIPGMEKQVNRIKDILNSIPKELTLTEANVMKRRIYDELRDVTYKLDAKLTTKASALKVIAKALKKEIENEVGGTIISDINKKLAIYGRLENTIVDQLAKGMRNNSFGLTDAILTTGGLSTMSPLGFLTGLGAAGIKHGLGSTTFRTTAAKVLNKGQSIGTGIVGRTTKETIRRGALNLP